MALDFAPVDFKQQSDCRLAKLLGKQPFGFPYHRDSCQLAATAGIFQMAGTVVKEVT